MGDLSGKEAVIMEHEAVGGSIILAGSLVQECANKAYSATGWSGVAGMAMNALIKVLMHQGRFEPADLATGIANGFANTFPFFNEEQLDEWLALIRKETLVQLDGVRAASGAPARG